MSITCLPFGIILFAHHFSTPAGNQLALSVAAFTLAAHVPATAAFYADRSLWPFMRRNRNRFVVAPLGAVVTGAVFTAWASDGLLSIGLTLYIAWQLHHFTRQNLGMLSFLLRSGGRPGVTSAERRLVDLTGIAGILGFAPLYAGIPGIKGGAQESVWYAGFGALVLAGVWLAHIWPRDPLRAVALTGIVLFYAPLFLYKGNVFAASIAYSTAHGAQYLLMAGHLASGRTRIVALRWFVGLAALVVIGGALLDRAGDLEGTSLRWVYGLGLGVTAAHFIVDAGLWRLRDPDQRAWMRERFAFL